MNDKDFNKLLDHLQKEVKDFCDAKRKEGVEGYIPLTSKKESRKFITNLVAQEVTNDLSISVSNMHERWLMKSGYSYFNPESVE